MTENRPTAVTVIGLGSMGGALAEAFIKAGHPTTVWNRTPAKAVSLVAAGARHANDINAAVTASPIVITCLTTFDDTLAALRPAAGALRGRALVTLNSGSPAGARQTAAWASGQGARFLAGAIKNVPSAVGASDTLLYYSGDKAVFEEFESTLKVLGGDTVHLAYTEGHPRNFDNSLYHVSYRAGALREVARVLRPGGIAVVSIPNRRTPLHLWSRVVARVVPPVKRVIPVGRPNRPPGPRLSRRPSPCAGTTTRATSPASASSARRPGTGGRSAPRARSRAGRPGS